VIPMYCAALALSEALGAQPRRLAFQHAVNDSMTALRER
jgi:hypothetical protein